jgi:hypothetical protein
MDVDIETPKKEIVQSTNKTEKSELKKAVKP